VARRGVLECALDAGGARPAGFEELDVDGKAGGRTDDRSWDVVLVTLERGCVAEALLCAALPTSWEAMVAAALRHCVTQAHDGGMLTGPGLVERFSLQCVGSKGQLVGRITETTKVRVQRMLEPRLMPMGEAQSSAHHVSAVDVLCSRAAGVTAADHEVVLWRLDEVCSSEDDPDEVKGGVHKLVQWLQQAEGDRLLVALRSVEKLAAPVRAVVPRVMSLAETSARDDGKTRAALELAVREVVGAQEAKSVLANLLLREAVESVVLVGPGGTGKTMLCSACAKCVPSARGTLSSLVQCYIGESERSLGALFASARQSGALVVLDDVDALLSGPTGRGLELQLSRELQRGGCRVLLSCSVLNPVVAALVSKVVLLAQPDGDERRQIFACFVVDGTVTDKLVRRTEHFSHAECVRLGRLVKLCGDDAEAALEMTGPFA
jgi:hypothetical protein